MALSLFSRGTPVTRAARPAREAPRARAENAAVADLADLYRQKANVRKVQLAVGDSPELAAVALELENAGPRRSTLTEWLQKRTTAP